MSSGKLVLYVFQNVIAWSILLYTMVDITLPVEIIRHFFYLKKMLVIKNAFVVLQDH